MINKVFLLGNLGGDPQVKFTKDGTMMVVFRLATSEYIKQNGTYEKFTEWHTVCAFGKLAEFSSKLKKGDKVFVEGKLRTSVFENGGKVFKISNIVAKSLKLIPRRRQEISLDHEIPLDIDELSEDGISEDSNSSDHNLRTSSANGANNETQRGEFWKTEIEEEEDVLF